VALPEPAPGLVIRYSYLWRREFLEGREEGQKDRPSAIVAAIIAEAGERRVLVLPITHSEPFEETDAIKIPSPVKRRLGLDGARSWIMISEYNEFVWPGPDLRRTPGADDGSVAYGMLPRSLFETVKQMLLERVKTGRARPVRRNE
jgi:hypothetical protein